MKDDYDFNFLDDMKLEEEEHPIKEQDEQNQPAQKRTHRRHAACIELSERYLYRRAFSEVSLLDIIPRDLQEGHSVHVITAGDVDSLSYLKCVLRVQNHLDHCLFSTWCMAAEDILQFDEWLTQGKIKKLDAYVGEIFPSSYKVEWRMLQDLFDRHQCGRIAVFRNHSKIYAGIGDKFAFGIETIANINTNPRTENGCITIGREIYEFYKSYFDDIVSFSFR